jgi:Gas vesicle synthesis protein GvpO/Gas vesicle protein G
MFLIDDVLLAPGKAAYVLFQQLARKAQEEWLDDDAIKQELQELYGLLEAGRITEKDFEASECRLLERLEQIARVKFQDKWGTVEAAPETPAATPIVEPSISVSPLPIAEPPQRPSFFLPATPVIDAVPVALPPPPSPSPAPQPPSPPAAPPPAAPPPAVVLAPMPPAPGAMLSIGQVMECAVRALAMLRMRVSTITSVVPDQANWKVSVELVERRGIPDTNDVLGLYELWLDPGGNVLRYERTHMRRRCDFAR